MALITSENAREYALRSHAPESARFEPKPSPQNPAPPPQDLFNVKMLMRARKQLNRLYDMFDEETEPQALDRLASALHRLSEIERQLSNRPLPGTLKPTSKPPRLMLSPAVDAGHAQATREQPASTPPNDEHKPEA